MATLADELAPYRIRSLESLQSGESEGSGSFGAVYRVKMKGFPCIAKRLHDILVGRMTGVQVSEREKASVQARFREECILLSKLRHPNIVQFIGVHYGRTRDDVTLVMECLYTDLHKCLEKCVEEKRTLPFPLQLSILLDVAYGLLYLHTQEPPIVHRDLKAENVLLTQHMRAKLADLGVSKILDLHPLSHMTRTVCPGTPAVMPPEALVKIPRYDTKLDDFSYGTLILHVTNHEFPMSYEITFAVQGQVQIAKRNDSIENMGRQHCLYNLVIRCLQDDPKKRPTTAEICATIERLTKDHPPQFKDVLEVHTKIAELQAAKIQANESLAGIKKEHENLQSEVTQMKADAGKLRETLATKQEMIAELIHVNNQWDVEYKEQEAAFRRYQKDSQQAHSKHIELIAELKEKQTGKEEMDAVVQTLKKTQEERDETVRLCKEAQRENEHLREHFEGARAQAHQVLEREKAKFEGEIQKLKQKQQAIVEAEKEAVRRKYRAKLQEKLAKVSQEQSSQLQQLYKQKLDQKEKKYQQRFLEYTDRIKEVSQEATELLKHQQEATRREIELRAELDQMKEAAARDVEHLQAQYQAELQKRDSQQGQEEGGKQSLKWENQHLHKVIEQQKGVISRLKARLGETEVQSADSLDNDHQYPSHQFHEEQKQESLKGERKREQAIADKEKGNTLFKEGYYQQAVECYTRSMQLDPLNAVLPANRAMALLKQEKYIAAEEDCSTALALDSSYVKAYFRRGSARMKLGKLAEAKEDFEEVVRLDPRNKEAKAEIEKVVKITVQ